MTGVIFIRTMNLIIGCDHRGVVLRDFLGDYLRDKGYPVIDVTCNEHANNGNGVDYPDIAKIVAAEVSAGRVNRGILICGSSIGMCIVANKFPGVRAAPCHNEILAELCRRHNDANVLCLPGDLLGEQSSIPIVEKWLTTDFVGGRHQDRIDKISHYEKCCPVG